jgi:hypothetical protein
MVDRQSSRPRRRRRARRGRRRRWPEAGPKRASDFPRARAGSATPAAAAVGLTTNDVSDCLQISQWLGYGSTPRNGTTVRPRASGERRARLPRGQRRRRSPKPAAAAPP